MVFKSGSGCAYQHARVYYKAVLVTGKAMNKHPAHLGAC